MENVEETHIDRKNLVGIIPVAGHDRYNFDQPWPDCMMPIASGYSLIESSVVECAWAGCKSIWIVANDNLSPIIRKKIGDWAYDPVWNNRNLEPNAIEARRRIPIFYTPVPLKHRDKIDCLSWSVIHGALTAFKLTSNLSRWTTPSKYYVSFPQSYFDPSQLREHRKLIAGPRNFYVSSNSMTVKDDFFTSFTFGKDDWIEFRKVIRTGTGIKVPGTNYLDDIKLPPEERWSARWFSVSKVFDSLDFDNSLEIPVKDFYNVRSWEEYVGFISASRKMTIKRPTKSILTGTSYNKVAEDDDEG